MRIISLMSYHQEPKFKLKYIMDILFINHNHLFTLSNMSISYRNLKEPWVLCVEHHMPSSMYHLQSLKIQHPLILIFPHPNQ